MTVPVVLDLNGTMRDWAWLRAKYGNVSYLEAAGYPKFQLIKVEEMEGPQTMIVNSEDENGAPHSGQPVVLSWPSLVAAVAGSARHSRGIEVLLHSRGVIQRTENGCTGFGLGGGSYISDPAVGGPYSVFVLSPSTYSDCLTGTGWLGGTNHMGPCRLTFRIVPAGVAPEPEPEPGADDDLDCLAGSDDCGGFGTERGGAGAVSRALGGIGWRVSGLFVNGWPDGLRMLRSGSAGARRRGARRAGRRWS